KWTTSVDRLVSLGISHKDSSFHLDQHILADQIISNYEGAAYPRRSTLPEEALESNTGDAMKPTEYRSLFGYFRWKCRLYQNSKSVNGLGCDTGVTGEWLGFVASLVFENLVCSCAAACCCIYSRDHRQVSRVANRDCRDHDSVSTA
ncbi:uncharacterized protein VP01_7380g1, partial [Puccinia sorghi]